MVFVDPSTLWANKTGTGTFPCQNVSDLAGVPDGSIAYPQGGEEHTRRCQLGATAHCSQRGIRVPCRRLLGSSV